MQYKKIVVILNRCLSQLFIKTTNNMEINQNSLQFLFGSTIRALLKQFIKEFDNQGINISPEQYNMLRILGSQEESIQSDLAEIMQKDKSAIMRHVDTMETMELVKRVNDAVDRRKKYIVITEKGLEMLNKCEDAIKILMDRNMKGISEDELSIFKKVLLKFKESAEA